MGAAGACLETPGRCRTARSEGVLCQSALGYGGVERQLFGLMTQILKITGP